MQSLEHIIKLQKTIFLTNSKDKLFLNQALVVYKLTCPGCKEERTLYERINEHANPNKKNNEQYPIYEHLSIC